jgi:hypothetical protein
MEDLDASKFLRQGRTICQTTGFYGNREGLRSSRAGVDLMLTRIMHEDEVFVTAVA